MALNKLERFEEALTSFDQALALKPDDAGAYSNRGNALRNLGRFGESLTSFDRAIALKADYAEAYFNRGITLQHLERHEDAIENYIQAIAYNHAYVSAYTNRAFTLRKLGRLEEALHCCEQILTLDPSCIDALICKGRIFSDKRLFFLSSEMYEKAFSLNKDYEYLLGMLIYSKNKICDWEDIDKIVSELKIKSKLYEKCALPFDIISSIDDTILQKIVSEIYIKNLQDIYLLSSDLQKRNISEKIRIGYYSADFHTHATMFLISEFFEHHDKNRFELIGFSFGPEKDDAMRQRVSAAFGTFIDVRRKTDKDIALLSRELGIDIAVDLKGFTRDCRPGIFAHRAAPIQVNYLGFPGTMGAEFMDYIIADPVLIPEESRQHYTEKIVYLPNSYQPNDRQRTISDRVFTRSQLGLPENGFVFCCFNNNYKITPDVFDIWVRILKAVEGSVLWLLEGNATAVANLRKEAAARDLDPARLVFAPRMPLSDHLARHRCADLFLDTFPCNAHTTASDALWAGLPLMTRLGESFASRVAASLLTAIGLPELITTSAEEYTALAIDLATNPDRLLAIKTKLAANRLTRPLFDSETYTRHLENAYLQMYERYMADLPPSHIFV